MSKQSTAVRAIYIGRLPSLDAPAFDPAAVLAHFAARKRVAHYRPTAHDKKKLALLQKAGYTYQEIVAAIDRAFDELPPGAPPIRMFSYCAAIVLATPPRRVSMSDPGMTARDGIPASSSASAAQNAPNRLDPAAYAEKFYGFIWAVEDYAGAPAVAPDIGERPAIWVRHPRDLGDDYEEIIQTLSLLAEGGLTLWITEPEPGTIPLRQLSQAWRDVLAAQADASEPESR